MVACVQTSPISACNKGNRRRLHAGKGNGRKEDRGARGRHIFGKLKTDLQ